MHRYIVRPARFFYYKIIRQSGEPEQIAMGMAIGTFTGFIFPPGLFLQVIVGALIAKVLKANQVSTFLGTWVSNPFFAFPMALFFIKLGSLVTTVEGNFIERITAAHEQGTPMLDVFKSQGFDFFLVYFCGSFLTAVVSIPIAYYVTKTLVVWYRKQRSKRLANRREEIRTQSFYKSDIKTEDK